MIASVVSGEKVQVEETHGSLLGGEETNGYGHLKSACVKVLKFVDDNYFMCMAFLGIVIAAIVPFVGKKGGPLRTEYSVSFAGNCVIFLISGLTLKTEALVNAIKNIKLNILIFINIFVTTTWVFIGLSVAMRSSVRLLLRASHNSYLLLAFRVLAACDENTFKNIVNTSIYVHDRE